MRVLVYSDAPSVPTGFGSVTRNIFLPLIEKGLFTDINFFGVNYTGEPYELQGIVKQWPAKIGQSDDPDPYGRNRFGHLCLSGKFEFDILFFLQDHFTVAPFAPHLIREMRKQYPQGRPPFRTIYYIPVDGQLIKPEWINWLPECIDYPVAYMNFGKDAICSMLPMLAGRMRVIYHGTNPETFFPVPEEQRREFRRNVMQVADSQPLIINVNRNQPRKDPARTMQIFAEVLKQKPNAILYMHCNPVDSMGFNLDVIRQQLRIPNGHVRYPGNFNEGVGVPLDKLNLFYNAADVFLTTARGEGFGLTVSESMCTGRCVVAPKHSSFAEMLADNRGILVDTMPYPEVMSLDNDQFRPVAEVEAMARKVVWAIDHPQHAAGIGRRAMEWAKSIAWREAICPEWEKLFVEAYESMHQPVNVGQVADYGLRPEALA